MRTRRAGGL